MLFWRKYKEFFYGIPQEISTGFAIILLKNKKNKTCHLYLISAQILD